MISKTEQFYIQHIAELEKQLKQRDDRIATLEKQVAELIKVNAELTYKVAKSSKFTKQSFVKSAEGQATGTEATRKPTLLFS